MKEGREEVDNEEEEKGEKGRAEAGRANKERRVLQCERALYLLASSHGPQQALFCPSLCPAVSSG